MMIIAILFAGAAHAQLSDMDSQPSLVDAAADPLVERLNARMELRVDGELIGTPTLSTVPGGTVRYTSHDDAFSVVLNYLEPADELYGRVSADMRNRAQNGQYMAVVELYLPTETPGMETWTRVASSVLLAKPDGTTVASTVPVKNAFMLQDPAKRNAETVEIKLGTIKAFIETSKLPTSTACDVKADSASSDMMRLGGSTGETPPGDGDDNCCTFACGKCCGDSACCSDPYNCSGSCCT